ncbi:hypothetical protein GCM10010271_13090 [Streptomyces kurssanovii]|nr:hypothetical protein GCM10010271_13090 [Streptomyces kurssanovii]
MVLAGTGVTAVAVTGGSGSTGADDDPRPVKAHTLALDGKDAKKRELPRTETQLFSLIGVSWEDSADDFEGTAQIRTRSADGGAWTDWRDLDFDIRAPESEEGDAAGVRGASEPLWVGPSDAVEARVVAGGKETAVPDALRLDMIDPGAGGDATQTAKPGRGVVQPQRTTTRKPTTQPAPSTTPATTEPGTPPASPTGGAGDGSSPPPSPSLEPTPSSPPPSGDPTSPGPSTEPTTAEPGDPSPPASSLEPSTIPPSPSGEPAGPTASTEPAPVPTVSPEPSPTETSAEPSSDPEPGTSPSATDTTPSVPPIVHRAGWGADESLVADPPSYLDKVDAVFVHHTAGTNSYDCAESPAIIRAILTYHVKTNGWNDIGYNFFVDKCGTVFEGRAGGVDKPVRGAHTFGFNGYSSGVSLLGDYENGGTPTPAAKQAIADVTAWKLGLHGVDPEAKVTLTAAGDTGVYKNGEQATLDTVSGHRDGFATLCPGATLYSALPEIRRTAGASVYAR